MSTVAFQRNIGSFIRSVAAFGALSVTTSNDGSPQAGLTIDREDYVPLALSALVSLQVDVTSLGASETLEVSITAEDSADGVTWDDLDVGPPDGVQATVLSEEGMAVVSRKVQLGAARRYVRFSYTPTLSASSGDTASVLGGVAVIGGYDELPANKPDTSTQS